MAAYDLIVAPGVILTKIVRWRTPTLDGNGNPVRDGSGQIIRVPVVTSAFTGLFVVLPPRSGTPVFQLTQTSSADGVLTNDGDGNFGLTISSIGTALLKSSMAYSFKVLDGSGNPVKELIAGKIVTE